MREKKDRNGGIKTIQIRKGETIKRLKPEDEGKEKRLKPYNLAALAEINPNRHFVALLPRLGRSTPLTCFAKGKQANRTSFEENPTTSLAAEELHLIRQLR